jgi:nitrogen fixation/metabolism regulation signal transduction histidine kinase
MTPQPISFDSQFALRERAQARLQAKGASLTSAKDPSQALRVLFDLASSPDTAPDALALLHELQVHQVELDLQNEELQRSRSELEAAWAYQLQWHDASPSAQLVLDESGRLMECNAGALKSLNQDIQQVLGKRLDSWLLAADVPGVQAWLSRAGQSAEPLSLQLKLHAQGQALHGVCAAARANPMAPGVLVAWLDAPSAS